MPGHLGLQHAPPAAGRRPWRCWPGGSAPAPAALVAAVTNPEWEPGRDEHEQYREHVLASLHATPRALVIKASDFTDNAMGVIHTTGPKLSKLAGKYGPLLPALLALILRRDTPLEADVKDMIAGHLDAAQGRFTVIGHGRGGESGTSQSSGAQPGSSYRIHGEQSTSWPPACGAAVLWSPDAPWRAIQCATGSAASQPSR